MPELERDPPEFPWVLDSESLGVSGLPGARLGAGAATALVEVGLAATPWWIMIGLARQRRPSPAGRRGAGLPGEPVDVDK